MKDMEKEMIEKLDEIKEMGIYALSVDYGDDYETDIDIPRDKRKGVFSHRYSPLHRSGNQ